jgi:hypothetical protein
LYLLQFTFLLDFVFFFSLGTIRQYSFYQIDLFSLLEKLQKKLFDTLHYDQTKQRKNIKEDSIFFLILLHYLNAV